MKSSTRHFISLLRYALPYKKTVLLQFVLMAISVGFGLLKPWPLKVLVDNVANEQPLQIGQWLLDWSWPIILLAACVAYLIFHAGEALVQIGSGVVSTLTSARMIRDLRAALLERVQRLSLRFHDSHKVGDLVYRITYNSTAVETAFVSGFMGTVKSALMLLGIFIVMVAMNPLLTLVALAVVPLLILSIRWYAAKTHRVSLEHQNQEGRISSRLQEILSSIRLVKAYNRSQHEHQRFGELCEGSVGTHINNTRVQKNFGFLTALVLAVGTALMFWVGMSQVKAGALTLGDFLVFVSYLAMLYSPLSVLSYTASSVQGALGGGTRLFEILDCDDEVPVKSNAHDAGALKHHIQFKDVSFGYDPENAILHNIDLTIPRGKVIAIVGETGCGKSTLLNLILRFYDPQLGAIRIDDCDAKDLTLVSLREQMAYVPQDNLLFSDSIRENIAYACPNATDEEVRRAATLAAAHSFIMDNPQGYATLVGERGVRLSAGQRQRLALARAFLKNAPVLLLDEPTSALDAETESEVMNNLAAMKDKTIVIVAHRLTTIRRADFIAVMHHGRIVEQGTHEELLAREGAYHRLWNMQATGYDFASGASGANR